MNKLSSTTLVRLFVVSTFSSVLAVGTPAQAQTQSVVPSIEATPKTTTTCPTVHIDGLKAGEGFVMLAAYDNASTFFKKSVWQVRLPVTDTKMVIAVCELANKDIAFTGFQDLNSNGKLDSNPLGIPAEPYGASGSPPAFGAPTWDATKVRVTADSIIHVKM
jgi:uncharacterized protein (DUF2141 family)